MRQSIILEMVRTRFSIYITTVVLVFRLYIMSDKVISMLILSGAVDTQ